MRWKTGCLAVVLTVALPALTACGGAGGEPKASPAGKPSESKEVTVNGFGCEVLTPGEAETATTTGQGGEAFQCSLKGIVTTLCGLAGEYLAHTPVVQPDTQYITWYPADRPNSDETVVSSQKLSTGWLQLSCFNAGQRSVTVFQPEFVSVLTGRCVLAGVTETELPEDYTAEVACDD